MFPIRRGIAGVSTDEILFFLWTVHSKGKISAVPKTLYAIHEPGRLFWLAESSYVFLGELIGAQIWLLPRIYTMAYIYLQASTQHRLSVVFLVPVKEKQGTR